MKLNTLFVAGVCASMFFASCNPKTAQENQLKYTHTSLADGDAYHFFQVVGAKAAYEADYAAAIEKSASEAQVKQVAAKAKEVYGSILPVLDSLAVVNQVDFPIKGAAKYEAPVADTTATHAVAAHGASDYVKHVQHESAIIKEQFERLSVNTNVGLREFAKANIEKVAELFKLAGGKEQAGGHH